MKKVNVCIVPTNRTVQSVGQEKNSSFQCQDGMVLTGMRHQGDASGNTWYEYASLKAIDSDGSDVQGTIAVEDVTWEEWFVEEEGNGFTASTGRVLVGRETQDDSEGRALVRYATAKVTFNGEDVTVAGAQTSSPIVESSGVWFKSDEESVLTGRRHIGDYDCNTYYTTSKLSYVLTVYGTDAAPEGSIIVIDQRFTSAEMNESSSYFLCGENMVMSGRYHSGDETKTTIYEYATLKALDKDGNRLAGDVIVDDIKWETVDNESQGPGFDAAVGRVVVGRQHSGDENGTTRYATGVVKYNGHATEIRQYGITAAKSESKWGWYKVEDNQVITGRHHYGDENGNTYYCFGSIYCDVQQKEQRPYNVIVALHPDETCFPMNPTDFIKLSRFRRHIEGGSDQGYSKADNKFHDNNDHDEEYYDIDVDVLKTFHNTGSYRLYNMRPRDDDQYGDNVFLEPDDNLYGDTKPNGRVPVFTYLSSPQTVSENGITETREIWLFFGYDKAVKVISGSHQGDWEKLTIEVVDNKIIGATLCQHDGSEHYTSSQLEISESNGVQTLTVYCAIGTHALYNSAKKIAIAGGLNHDETLGGGYRWEVMDCMEPLEEQSWKDYAGGWGEVGELQHSTGPLGPWPKHADIIAYQDASYNLSPLSAISDSQILIVPDEATRAWSSDIKESAGVAFECEEGKVITGMYHNGDENGVTRYQTASLIAINKKSEKVVGKVTITDKMWSGTRDENESGDFFTPPAGRVIIGRQHVGDENGTTRYLTGIVKFREKTGTCGHFPSSQLRVRQSRGFFFKSAPKYILQSRFHTGDETGMTTYTQGFIIIS